MSRELLLDTGAVVFVLDRSQARHLAFVQFFQTWEAKVVSTEAVLAEATLVVLAEELGTNLVLTTDRRDFGIYRLADGRSFEVVP